MKREIKFRAWNLEQSRFIDLNGVDIAFKNCLNTGSVNVVYEQHNLHPFEIDEVELMQFTGLKDKNGKDIFEGDVIDNDGLIMTIEYVNASFCMCNDKGNWIIHSHDAIEVIGNIYEHESLLK